MDVLYRKYRVKSFKGLAGADAITRILKNSLKTGKLSHAYIFTGPRGTGKTSTARILAKSLNCLNLKEDFEPCNKCKVCMDIDKGLWVDLIEIDAASNRGVDEIRTLKENIGFLPSEGKYRVYIIDEVHMLTKEAFNALLKTLEEPPSHAVFILATTEINKVPATILSRCQRFDFYPGTVDEIVRVLGKISKKEGVEVPNDILTLLATHSGGSYRDGISLLQKCIGLIFEGAKYDDLIDTLGLDSNTFALDIVNALMKGEPDKSLQLLEEYIDKGKDVYKLNEYILKILRNNLIHDTNSDLVISYIKLFIEAERNFKFTPIPQLPVEVALIQCINLNKKSGVKVKQSVSAVSPTVDQPKIKIENIKTIIENDDKEYGSSKKDDDSEKSNISDLPVTEEDITNVWKDFLSNMKHYNHHITAFLSMCNFEIKNGSLIIKAPFDFYKERIEDRKTLANIKEVLEKLVLKKLNVSVLIEKGVKPVKIKESEYDKIDTSPQESDAVIDNIIAAFS